jgi:hypothetical protein
MTEGAERCWCMVGRVDDGHAFERSYFGILLVTLLITVGKFPLTYSRQPIDEDTALGELGKETGSFKVPSDLVSDSIFWFLNPNLQRVQQGDHAIQRRLCMFNELELATAQQVMGGNRAVTMGMAGRQVPSI